MDKEDVQDWRAYVRDAVDAQDFEHVLKYWNLDLVPDKKFHELRVAYRDAVRATFIARQALEQYIGLDE